MIDACTNCGLKESPYYDSDGLCPLCSPDFDSGNMPDSTDSIRESAVNEPNDDDPGDSALAIRQRAQALIAQHGGIRPAARARGREMGCKVNPGIIGLALKGKDFPAARRALGLPPKTVPVEPCADCGEVHERLHTCEEDRQRNKRTAANGHFRRAVWIHEDDMPLFDALLARHGVRTLQELIDNHMIYRRRLDDD